MRKTAGSSEPGRDARNREQRGSVPIIGVVVVALLLIVLLFGKRLGLPADLISVLSGPRSPRIKASDWRKVSPAGSGFTVDVPGEPVLEESTSSAGGPALTVRTYKVRLTDNDLFLVKYSDVRELLQGADGTALLDESRASAARSVNGELVSETPVRVGPVPGRELLVRRKGGMMRARSYVHEGYLYTMQILSTKDVVASKDAERFFASFAFSGSARSEAAAPPGWKEFTDAAGRFAVLAPGNPVAGQESISTRAGEVTLHQFTLRRSDSSDKLVVQYMDYPELLLQGKSAGEVLKNAGTVDAFNLNGVVVRELDQPLGRHAGREVTVENATTIMKIRLYLVDQRLYKVVAMRPRNRAVTADDDLFLASFRILP